MAERKRKNYVKKEEMLAEIIACKKKHAENPGKTVAECLSNKLVLQIDMIINRFAQKYNWRDYSFIEDMKCYAMMCLMESALKFDPDRSNNPFGYYTQIIYRCFLTFLEKEKQLRQIRDDLIEMSGSSLKPSFSRQFEGGDDYAGDYDIFGGGGE